VFGYDGGRAYFAIAEFRMLMKIPAPGGDLRFHLTRSKGPRGFRLGPIGVFRAQRLCAFGGLRTTNAEKYGQRTVREATNAPPT
jgi:hypothetical protein